MASDGSRRFRLIGGKHDAAGKKTVKGGFWVRIYPDEPAHVLFGGHSDKPAVWPTEFEIDGEVYAVPDQGNEARFIRKTEAA